MSLGAQFDTVIAGATTGAPWALEALYVDLQPRVLRYLSAIDRNAAEDLASETWLGVARALPKFSGDEDDFRALVFTVARRRLLDHRRREIQRRTAVADPRTMEQLGPVSDVEQEAIERLGRGWALDQIAALPSDQAEVVLLRVIGDLSVEEVAAIVGKRPGAIRALQLRALRRLARQLAKEPVTP
jgi:RNA polymerase sigma factor (sigma-70 family)